MVNMLAQSIRNTESTLEVASTGRPKPVILLTQLYVHLTVDEDHLTESEAREI